MHDFDEIRPDPPYTAGQFLRAAALGIGVFYLVIYGLCYLSAFILERQSADGRKADMVRSAGSR